MSQGPEYKAGADRVTLEPGKFAPVVGEPDTWEVVDESGGIVHIWHDYPVPDGAPPENEQSHPLEPGDKVQLVGHVNGILVKIKPA